MSSQSWTRLLEQEFQQDYFKNLKQFLVNETNEKHTIYPNPSDIFRAFDLCPYKDIKVVIIGQDPYHGPGQAHGLSFSVPDGVRPPPSLKNIYKELGIDLGLPIPKNGNLEPWARQGVLLLNATLTVQARTPNSHNGKGWETLTDNIISHLNKEKENIVFLLWGKYAQNKGSIIDTSKHLVLTAAHPSPFSAYNGFFGCKHFSQTNDYLEEKGIMTIDWKL